MWIRFMKRKQVTKDWCRGQHQFNLENYDNVHFIFLTVD